MTLISVENPFTFYTEVTPLPHPRGHVLGFENRFTTHRSSGFAKSFFLATKLQWISKEPGTRWKRLFQVILHRTLLLTRIIWLALGLSLHPPTSTRQCYDPKRTHFHPFCSKFNIVWSGSGEVPSLTNITRKVPTLLMSIVEFLARWTEKLFDCVLYCLPHLFDLPAVQQRI